MVDSRLATGLGLVVLAALALALTWAVAAVLSVDRGADLVTTYAGALPAARVADIAAGLGLIVAGGLATTQPRTRRLGVLALLAGLAWFGADWEGAESAELKEAFEKHLLETEEQVSRLEQVFELLGMPARGKACPAIDGIIEEGAEILEQYKGLPAIDAGLVAAAQAVEHYEIARYGTLVSWATQLGMSDAADLLGATLDEEEATDEALTAIAEGGANERAVTEIA